MLHGITPNLGIMRYAYVTLFLLATVFLWHDIKGYVALSSGISRNISHLSLVFSKHTHKPLEYWENASHSWDI